MLAGGIELWLDKDGNCMEKVDGELIDMHIAEPPRRATGFRVTHPQRIGSAKKPPHLGTLRAGVRFDCRLQLHRIKRPLPAIFQAYKPAATPRW
jgi:hypothetical protein